MFGNPHSQNPPSRAMGRGWRPPGLRSWSFSRLTGGVRGDLHPERYGALRLVGESYPFGPGGRYLLTFDNHNSVDGIREFARAERRLGQLRPLTPADYAYPRRRWTTT